MSALTATVLIVIFWGGLFGFQSIMVSNKPLWILAVLSQLWVLPLTLLDWQYATPVLLASILLSFASSIQTEQRKS